MAADRTGVVLQAVGAIARGPVGICRAAGIGVIIGGIIGIPGAIRAGNGWMMPA